MTKSDIIIRNVRYNAASQCFEALVTLSTGTASKSFPCAIEAPITMSFEDAAEGLKTQALRREEKGAGLFSQMRHRATQRAGRARFDPRTWLTELGFGSLDKAA